MFTRRMRRRCTECGRFIWILVLCATRRSIVVRITRNATQKNPPDKTWWDSAAVTYGDSCGEWTAKPSPIDATTRTSFVHTRKQTMSRLKKTELRPLLFGRVEKSPPPSLYIAALYVTKVYNYMHFHTMWKEQLWKKKLLLLIVPGLK